MHPLAAFFLPVSCSLALAAPSAAQDLIVSGNTSLGPGTFVYDRVVVLPGGTLTLLSDPNLNPPWGLGTTILANEITVEANGAISADAQGFPSGQGPGAGGPSGYHAGGAGHGGRGETGSGLGGLPYGDPLAPVALGSGGGTVSGSPGGAGGGGADFSLPVPPGAQWLGRVGFFQAAVTDPAGPSHGVTLSDVLKVTVGLP